MHITASIPQRNEVAHNEVDREEVDREDVAALDSLDGTTGTQHGGAICTTEDAADEGEGSDDTDDDLSPADYIGKLSGDRNEGSVGEEGVNKIRHTGLWHRARARCEAELSKGW